MSSLILIKPDCIERGLVGETLSMLALVRGFCVVGMKSTRMTQTKCEQHYAEHVNKPFFDGLAMAMVGKPVVAMYVDGDVLAIREMCKVIRETYCPPRYVGPLNLVHSSDSHESTVRELQVWFPGCLVAGAK